MRNNLQKLQELQEITGYRFKDISLLELAMSHSSYSNEKHTGKLGSNERLEFLGDSVLELVSSELFYNTYPDVDEGELTKVRARNVCEQALYDAAEKIPLSKYIHLGKGEESSGGRKRPSVVSDAFEALMGAVYIDGGYEAAREFILKNALSDIVKEGSLHEGIDISSKTRLQEELRKINAGEPEYVVVSESGPDHDKKYSVEVRVQGEIRGTGTASSKKHAEQIAAGEALKKMDKE